MQQVQFFVSFLISCSLTVSLPLLLVIRIIMWMNIYLMTRIQRDEPKRLNIKWSCCPSLRRRVEFPTVSAWLHNLPKFLLSSPFTTATTTTSPTIMAANLAISSGDLLDLVSSSGSATIYPSDDTILSVLQARFRSDLPYTRIRNTNLLVVNPYKTVNDVVVLESTRNAVTRTPPDSPRPLQPHLYDVAARVYLLMRRMIQLRSSFSINLVSRPRFGRYFLHVPHRQPTPHFSLRSKRIRRILHQFRWRDASILRPST